MRWLTIVLSIFLIILQYRLWVGQGSLADVSRMQREIAKQVEHNQRAAQRNQQLRREVEALKQGGESIEQRARYDLGMIRKGETFYFVVE